MDIAIKVSVCPTGNVKDDLFKKIPVVKIADGSIKYPVESISILSIEKSEISLQDIVTVCTTYNKPIFS